MFELNSEQEYVMKHASRLGIEIKFFKFDETTSTCKEKADMLTRFYGKEFPVIRTVKALYPYNKKKKNFVGIILPETEIKEDFNEMFNENLKCSFNENYRFNSECINGSEMGTHPPFPYKSSIEHREIEYLLVCNYPLLDDSFVDISVGGIGKEAHKKSIQLPYSGIYRILIAEFGDKKIKRFDFSELW